MPLRRSSKLRSVILAAFSAVAALMATVSSALADSTGGPFP